MANPAPTINQINAFNATQGTTIDFNIIGGTELVRSNRIYIYDLSDNSLICTHLYVSTESIHELPANTDSSIVYESGKSSADFVNGAQYYAQIQTFTDIGGTEGGSGLSVAKMFWCLNNPTLTIDIIPSTISTTSYNVSATYNANTSVVSNIIQQYQFSLYSATGSLLQSSGVIVGNGEQQGTSTAYDISYNFTGLSVGSSYYVVVDVTTTQGMSISAQSGTFTVSIDTPTLGEATVVNNACDGYISVTSNLSSEYGGSGSGEIVSFETDSENVFTELKVAIEPTQSGSGDPSPSNVRPIYGVGGVTVVDCGKNLFDKNAVSTGKWLSTTTGLEENAGNYVVSDYIPVASGVSVFIPMSGTARRWFYDVNKTPKTYLNNSSNQAYTPTENGYIRVSVLVAGSGAISLDDYQIEVGSTATTYEPYTEQTVSQDFNVTLTPTVIDETPYLFKATGDVRGDKESLELVGGTVNWNQLVNPDMNTRTVNGITVTNNNDGTFTVNGTATADSRIAFTTWNGFGAHQLIGHKILIIGCPSGGSRTTYAYGIAWIGEGYSDIGNGSIFNIPDTQYTGAPSVIVANGVTLTNKTFIPQLIDLTAFFGNSSIADYVYSLETANAGAGIAWLRKYFPDLFVYNAYDTGTLKSVKPTAHVTRGVNQWDEEWEIGSLDTTTGLDKVDSTKIRSKNYIRVDDTAHYYCHNGANTSVFAFCYDAGKHYTGELAMRVSNNATQIANAEFYLPQGTEYIRFYVANISSYSNNICINISDSDLNGKYFPADHHTYPISELELRGIPKLVDGELMFDGDTRSASGSVSRKYYYLKIDGDTELNIGGNVSNDVRYTTFSTLPIASINTNATNPRLLSNEFISASGVEIGNAYVTGNGTILVCVFKDQTLDTATKVKNYLASHPIEFILPRASSATETADPFTDPQEVSIYGTEEFVSSNGVPVGNKTTYKTRDIFGGTLDLVSGRLVVDRKYVLGDTLDWVYVSSGTYFYAIISDKEKGYNNVTCNIYATAQQAGVANLQNNQIVGGMNDTAVYVKDSRYTNATTFKQAMSETGILYELATPLTYQLTPKQIQTLVGTNNVWSEQGDIELSYHIPITNLLVKRQDIDDVSGNWLTLYSQPITQASDMDFTFIDFLNQYGKTYKYALVPLLTQTQSGVEVEVEGGYTVSDEVQSIFDGVFISDSTGSQKCKANVGYGNVNMNQSVGSITPIGSQYPIIVTNSNNRYHNGSISGMIVPDDYYYNGNLSRIDMVNKRNELEQFLTNKRAKIIKDWNSNIWLVMIMDNIDCSFDNNYGMGMVTFNANWLEVGDPTNQQDLQDTGLINVGGV